MHRSITPPGWNTMSFGGTADTSPMELNELGDHLTACRGQQGRFLALRCAAERLHVHVATRIVTSLVIAVALLIGICTLLLWGSPA